MQIEVRRSAATDAAAPLQAQDLRSSRCRWLSLKAVACHLTLVLLVPAFLLAAWWQLQRAESGNALSYIYCVEWPIFAGVAVWVWWQVIHLPPAASGTGRPAATGWLQWDPADESPALRAYNLYLTELNRTGGRPGLRAAGPGRAPRLASPRRVSPPAPRG